MEKHYKILGLETTATLEEVKEKFNILYKEYDPEKQTDDLKEFFKEEHEKVTEAYKEICLNIIHQKREDEEEEEIKKEDKEEEEFDWEEDKKKIVEEKEDQEYRKTIHSNQFDESDLEITNIGKEGLDKMVYWSKFLSVVGYIFLGILSILALKLFGEWAEEPSRIKSRDWDDYRRYDYLTNYRKERLFEELVVCVIFIVVWFFPVRYLNRFASKTRRSLTYNDNKELGEGLENLGSFFKFYGVIMILWLCFLYYYFETNNIWDAIF
jgi:hypothetical protein